MSSLSSVLSRTRFVFSSVLCSFDSSREYYHSQTVLFDEGIREKYFSYHHYFYCIFVMFYLYLRQMKRKANIEAIMSNYGQT